MKSPKRAADTPKDIVLFVNPKELNTIWLEISTLVGKVKTSHKKREDPVAILSMLDKESKKELWKVIKDYSSLVALDQSLRPSLAQYNIPKLPERALFQSHAPSRVDSRKVALEDYFFTILKLPSIPAAAARSLCEFMSTDMIDPMDIPDTPSRREGYLTKRGKKIRGWKVRYFVIEGDCLNYYDNPGGEIQGSISLINAKLGRQTSKNDEGSLNDEPIEKSFRHAFLLVEQKKRDYTRHVLCAESDVDRDLWIDALMDAIAQVTETPLMPPVNESNTGSPKKPVTSAPFSPLDETHHDNGGRIAVIPPPHPQHELHHSNNNLVPAQSPTWSKNKSLMDVVPSLNDLRPTVSIEEDDKDAKKHKKKGFFSSFRSKNANVGNVPATPSVQHYPEPSVNTFQATPYSAVEQKPMNTEINAYPPKNDAPALHALGISLEDVISSQAETPFTPSEASTNKGPYTDSPGSTTVKRVFGVPLAEAVSLASKNVHHCKVPAIVYRCIEHLKIRDAIFEEGIFRLSGSTATIRSLKDRFNREYDVDLVKSDTFYDIHAVAGLLKLYLREIPTLILSSYLAPEFREAVDIQDPTVKILKLKSLVHELPRENRDLLCVLCSLLTEIIAHSDINKMNLRNVGIVFAPTLNISAYVLVHFLTDFDAIFGDLDEVDSLEQTVGVQEASGSEYGDEPELDEIFDETKARALNAESNKA